ncbi:unnamed protein product [Adineta steineri]|uniref:PARP catalytic domain-containing protein n=1 Tax=Adineta steineri TaxID=433720 RepID=A0A813N2V5_9BILA|nr:unnamed protein product [Adineta steineri]CAF4221974.1 unnamed protein product [Adineta steineri]
MASDNFYDGFDYNSSQDDVEIEYQIYLFEIRQCSKAKKLRIPSYRFSRKTSKSQHPLIKINNIDNKRTVEVEQKIFRYTRYPSKQAKNIIKGFECDKQFQTKSDCAQPNVSLQTVRPHDFTTFRRHFYRTNHQQIKSSLKHQTNIEIINIRLAPINQSIQNDFMKRFNENTSYYPHLVYHGTKLTNIKSILRYGFLIPNQPHPTNTKAPIIATQNGSAYGAGIYCSETADYSLSYTNTTNTLLVCAALPKRNGAGSIERSHGNILVLSHVSEIIPLFLIDIQYLSESNLNKPWFNQQYPLKMNIKDDANKPLIISRKYLRKVLNYMKDEVRKNRRYRGRRNNQHKIRREDEYQVRVFEPFS